MKKSSLELLVGGDFGPEYSSYQDYIFQTNPEAIVVMDVLGNIVDCNNSYLKLSGWEKSNLIGKNIEFSRKGLNSPDVISEMWNCLKERNIWEGDLINRTFDGKVFDEKTIVTPMVSATGSLLGFYSVKKDVTELKNLDKKAKFDDLTGLHNRFYFEYNFENILKESEESGEYVGLLFMDLDGFKNANDSIGHFYGDKLLIEAANRFKKTSRSGDLIGRIGGDEFVYCISGFRNEQSLLKSCEIVSNRIISEINRPIQIPGYDPYHLGISIGVSYLPNEKLDFTKDSLIESADKAMYRAKKSGKNRVEFF